jgi:hypothetical protein
MVPTACVPTVDALAGHLPPVPGPLHSGRMPWLSFNTRGCQEQKQCAPELRLGRCRLAPASPTWIELASRLGARLPRGSRAIANDGATTFYKIWTLREAFAKATGLGFMQLVYGRDYFSNTPDTQVWCGPEQHQGWVFGYQLTSATYATAFAMTICNNRLRAVDDTVLSSTSSIVDAARTAWLSISQYCR